MNRSIPSPGGNPAFHNHDRASERRLDRVMKGWMRVHTSRGWRRKKQIMRVEGGRLRELVVAVAKDLSEKRHAV